MRDAAQDWRRASRGLFLMGLGVFLLLTTLGILDWSFWLEAFAWWPLLLIGIGLRLIFERSSAPWLILLSPIVVLGTLAWVAVSHPAWGGGEWVSVAAEAPEETSRWSFRAKMAMVHLDLSSHALPPGQLVEGKVSPSSERNIEVHRSRTSARVDMSSWRPRRLHFLPPGDRRTWVLAVTDALPVEMDLDGAFSEGDADLSGLRLTRLEMQGAFQDFRLRLGHPEGEVRLYVEGAFNEIRILVPPDTPVSVSSEGVVNMVHGRDRPPSGSGPGYRLRVEGVFNRVDVRTDPDAVASTVPGGRVEGGSSRASPARVVP